MDYVDLKVEARRLEESLDSKRLSLLLELLEAYPNLRAFRDHWGQIRYCSASANSETDSIDFHHQSLEHDGLPLEIWPYAVITGEGTRLYSDPPLFVVADAKAGGFGQCPRPGWFEMLEAASLSRSVIAKVRDYLDRHPPIDYDSK